MNVPYIYFSKSEKKYKYYVVTTDETGRLKVGDVLRNFPRVLVKNIEELLPKE